jgi:MFS family permease
MLKTKGNRHRVFIGITLGVFAQWNGVGIVSYYLAPVLKTVGVTDVTNQTMISGFLQVWNLIIAVSAAFSIDRLGRRFLCLVSCGGMLTSYIIISGLSGSFAHTNKAGTGIAVIPSCSSTTASTTSLLRRWLCPTGSYPSISAPLPPLSSKSPRP